MSQPTRKPSPEPWAIRSVVFDLDGLLLDTEPIFHEAARRLLERRGLSLNPLVMQGMMGMPARQALPFFRQEHQLSEPDEVIAVEAYQLFFTILGTEPAPLLPGAREIIERLERMQVPKALATSSSAAYVQRVLEPHQLLSRFDFVLTCDDVQHGKPHPEIYERAAARFGHAPAQMLVLEDSPNGLRAAKAAGARCVVVPHALVPLGELAAADAIVESLAAEQLLNLVRIARQGS